MMRRSIPLHEDVDNDSLPSWEERRLMVQASGGSVRNCFNQSSSLDPTSERVFSAYVSYGWALRCFLGIHVSLMFHIIVLLPGFPVILSLDLFGRVVGVIIAALPALLYIPFIYELYDDGTVSVVTLLRKRWNFPRCRRPYTWVDGGVPGVPFRPMIKLAMSNKDAILITRGEEHESDFHLVISPRDPDLFMDAILMNTARLETLQETI